MYQKGSLIHRNSYQIGKNCGGLHADKWQILLLFYMFILCTTKLFLRKSQTFEYKERTDQKKIYII